MAKLQHAGGGRYRPTTATGGMRASMAAADAAERAILERIRRQKEAQSQTRPTSAPQPENQ